MAIIKNKLIYSKIAGVSHCNQDGTSRQYLIAKHLYPGSKLILKPESNNPYDMNAIAIFIKTTSFFGLIEREKQVGYVTSYLAENLAKYLYDGGKVNAEVIEMTGPKILGANISILPLT